MKYCTSCGKELNDRAKFCTGCGTKCAVDIEDNIQPVHVSQELPQAEELPNVEPAYQEAAPANDVTLEEEAGQETPIPQVEPERQSEPIDPPMKKRKPIPTGRIILFSILGIVLVVLVSTAALCLNNSKVHEHSWRAASCEIPKTCDECGETEGTSLGHLWINATYDTPKTCAVCRATEGQPAGYHVAQETSHTHHWEDATYNEPKTCQICGETEGSKKNPSSSLGLRDIISSASASSVYSGDNLGRHGPEKMYDGKLDTNWTENVSGTGIGEYVTFHFDDIYAVKKLEIYIGSHYNEGVYRQNCRPKVIKLTFSDGSTERIALEDSYSVQTITFDQYYYTDYVILTIEDVYTGTKYLDTVIAELDFVAYRP